MEIPGILVFGVFAVLAIGWYLLGREMRGHGSDAGAATRDLHRRHRRH